MTTRAYFWIGKPNFGDLLSPLLLERFAHLSVEWAPVVEAEIVMVGSILEAVPATFTGTVLGTGKLLEHTKVHLPQANIAALRGPLTAKGVPGDYVLGDAALLANELVAVNKTYKLGIVPHWSDTELEHRPEFKQFDPRIIRPSGDPLEVIREIGRCRKIVSSSLHGIILADAFGIPRRVEIAPRLRNHEGGTFKFRDHDAAVGMEFQEGGPAREAPRFRVQDLQHALFDAIEKVGRTYA